jgi:hypothetical protein
MALDSLVKSRNILLLLSPFDQSIFLDNKAGDEGRQVYGKTAKTAFSWTRLAQ